MYVRIEWPEIDRHHLIFAEQGGRCPVVAKPGLFVGIGCRNRASKGFAGTVVKYFDPVAFQIEGHLEAVVDNPAAPALGAVVKAPANQFRIGQNARDGCQFRVLFGQVFRDQPVFCATIGEHVGDGFDFPLCLQLLIDRRGVDPHLGRDIRFAIFGERGCGGHCVGRDDGHRAAITLFHDELRNVGHDRG